MSVTEIVLDDALCNTHVHVRTGKVCRDVVSDTSRIFGIAGCQGNLKNDEVTTVARAEQYRREILAATSHSDFQPMMLLYLTEETTKEEIDRVADSEIMLGVKMYQRGASGTTGSSKGIRKPQTVYPILEHMEKRRVPLVIHAEDPNEDVDHFDREAFFIDREVQPIVHHFPELQIAIAHISTTTAVEFILSASDLVSGEVTPMHLLLNRNALWLGGLMRGQNNCLPVLKRERHRQAIEDVVIGKESKKFDYGDDSAPHEDKDAYSCCAGCYAARAGFEATVERFDDRNALHLVPDFMGARAIARYGKLHPFKRRLVLRKQSWVVPMKVGNIVPLFAGETMKWQVVSE